MYKMYGKRSVWFSLGATAVVLGTLGATGLGAAEPVFDDCDGWDVHVGLSFWGAGLDGTVRIGAFEAEVDKDFDDIFDIMDFVGGINFEARRCGWLLFANGQYLKSSLDADPILLNDVDLEQHSITSDFGLGYNVIPHQHPFALEPFVGGRIRYVKNEISVEGPAGGDTSDDDSEFWADPIVGAFATYRFGKAFAVFAEADIGGFGVSSDITWQAQGGVEWNITEHLYFRAAYRHLVTEFDKDDFEFDMEQSGPQLELGVRF